MQPFAALRPPHQKAGDHIGAGHAGEFNRNIPDDFHARCLCLLPDQLLQLGRSLRHDHVDQRVLAVDKRVVPVREAVRRRVHHGATVAISPCNINIRRDRGRTDGFNDGNPLGQTSPMSEKRAETSDGRHVEVSPGVWWDTTGIDLVDQITVDGYLDDHPDVGIDVKMFV